MRITSCLPSDALAVMSRGVRDGGRFPWRKPLRQVWFRRAVAVIVLLAFLPVVSAMVICEAECLARALGGDEVPHTSGHSAYAGHGDAGPSPVGHLHEEGPCHMAATPIFVLAGVGGVAAVPIDDQELAHTPPSFASVAWPPPRPRPKAGTSS